MKKFLIYLVAAVVILGGLLRFSLEFEGMQDTAMDQMARAAMKRNAEGLPNPDALRVFMCGTASPLGVGRAQACIAILTPSHFYMIDVGAGAAAVVQRANLPMQRLQGVLLTHFHSDHIAELYEVNLQSWVRGRPEPLMIYGPKGVRSVVKGINDTYELDRGYRITHHGEDLLPEHLGILEHKTIDERTVLEDGDLSITAYIAEHHPATPALGYRVEYRGRSVVVSGDSNVTPVTVIASKGADLLLHNALSVPLVTTMAKAAKQAGADRLSKIATDVLDYHASVESLIDLGEKADIGMVGYYHLVPVPATIVQQKFFERNLPENYVVTDDGDWFELPSNSDEIKHIRP